MYFTATKKLIAFRKLETNDALESDDNYATDMIKI